MKKIVRFHHGCTYWPPKGGMFARLTNAAGETWNVRAIQNISFDDAGNPTRIETLNYIHVQVLA